MRTLLPFLCLLSVPAFAQFPLNDTGQDLCFEGGDRVACTEANTGDASTHPRQDGRFGRDAQAGAGTLVKQGAGAAGFDFTKVCNSGQPASTGTCPADPMLGAGEDDWACTRDNVTGRVWEVKTPGNADDTFNFANASDVHADAVNTAQLCGDTDWRVPTRRELLSIVHYGATSSPRIDTTFFPNTEVGTYWSSDIYDLNQNFAWSVLFGSGSTFFGNQISAFHVRLVRSVP